MTFVLCVYISFYWTYVKGINYAQYCSFWTYPVHITVLCTFHFYFQNVFTDSPSTLVFVYLYFNETHLRITFHFWTSKATVIAASRVGAVHRPQPLHCDNATKDVESAYRRVCVYFHHLVSHKRFLSYPYTRHQHSIRRCSTWRPWA